MTKPVVFVSYNHKDEGEKEALLAHLSVLERAGLIEVWVDDRIDGGADWAEAIKQAIDQAHVAVLLISANFLTSDFILGSEVPAFLERRSNAGVTVFPVIAKACAWQAFDWLSKLNVRPKNGRPIWSGSPAQIDEDLSAIVTEVAALAKQVKTRPEPGPISSTPEPAPELGNSPPPSLEPIEPPYGTMRPDSRYYIERAADHNCLTLIGQPFASTIFVQAPRQMGKSSLMRRMIHAAETQYKQQTVFIDFQKVPGEYLDDEESLLIDLCLMISDALNLADATDKFWAGRRTNIVKCSRYLSQYVLPQVASRLVLAMDEVESMLSSPFRANFFGMLRTWHNDRVFDENFAKMSLFLSSSTEPYLFIDNPHQSPFNVAELVHLPDFSPADVAELNRRHHNLLTADELEALIELVGGHPFLTRLAFYQLATQKFSLKTLLAQASEDTGPFGDHLRHYLLRVLQKPELKAAIEHIVRYETHEENQIYHRLKGAGLVRKEGQRVYLRNPLYTRYFEERLNG